jgi:DNA-binding NarL/FixJ family response regulator
MVAHRRGQVIRLWCIRLGDRNGIAGTKDRIRSPTVGKDLSMREQAVLALLRKGQSNKEMSAALGISTRTVQTYLRRIYWHLGVQTRAEAIVALYEGSSRRP